MPQMTEVHIAFAVDRGYLDQVAVVVASVIANAAQPGALRFHVLHAEDQEFVAAQVARWGVQHVEQHRIDNPFADYEAKAGSFWTTAMLFRLLLPSVLSHLDRVIYMDADVIVLHDIAELWSADLGGAPIGGVTDIGVYQKLVREDARGGRQFRDHMLSLGMDLTRRQYVNSGLLLLDLQQLRANNFAEQVRDQYTARRDRLWYADQDIINVVMRDQIRHLDPRWNVLAATHSHGASRWHHFIPDDLQPALALQQSEQWLIHYTGANKPWNTAEVWREEAWWRYAARTDRDWRRPEPVSQSKLARMADDAWMSLKSRLSAFRHRARTRGAKQSRR